jgi:uncharacterized delta-60 repeat protein
LENRKLLAAGQLDPSFGAGGKVTVDFHGTLVQSTVVATQADGKTVVAGPSHDPGHETDVALTRLNVNGTLDTTFGPNHNGIVRSFQVDSVRAIAMQSDGKILVAGDALSGMYVARFTSTGNLDTSFDGDGIANINVFGNTRAGARGLAIQSDGKIVVVGFDFEGFINLTDNFAVVRLNSNGKPDTSFNGDGKQTFDFGDMGAFANAVTIDYTGTPSRNPYYGTIVVAGFTGDKNDFDSNTPVHEKFAVARIKSNGDLDDRFGNGGQVTLAVPHLNDAEATGVAVQSGGRVVVSGFTGANITGSGHVFTVARFKSNGHLDTAFGGANTGFSSAGFGGNDKAFSLVIGQSSRLIVGGNADNLMAFACFSSNGALDQSFGSHGKVTVNFGGAFASGMAYGPGNRFVATGGGQFNTVRLLDTGGRLVKLSITSNTASETGPKSVTFGVSREEKLPFATRVYFTVNGTATPPGPSAIGFHFNDYSLTGMTFPLAQIGHPSIPFVDIPANQFNALVTLTPIDRKMNDGDKTAIFTIMNDPAYNIDSPAGVKINIQDKTALLPDLAPAADAYVRDGGSANTNFGTAADLEVKAAGAGFNRVSYLKFDLSSVSVVNTVTLNLFGNLSAAQSGVTTSLFSVADTSWTENGITFNNAPAGGASPLASATVTGTTGSSYTLDITNYVKSQLAAGHHTISLMLKNLSTSNAVVIFNSRESSDVRHIPFLSFT